RRKVTVLNQIVDVEEDIASSERHRFKPTRETGFDLSRHTSQQEVLIQEMTVVFHARHPSEAPDTFPRVDPAVRGWDNPLHTRVPGFSAGRWRRRGPRTRSRATEEEPRPMQSLRARGRAAPTPLFHPA